MWVVVVWVRGVRRLWLGGGGGCVAGLCVVGGGGWEGGGRGMCAGGWVVGWRQEEEGAVLGMGGGWGVDGVRQAGDWVCGLVVCGVGVWVRG